MKSITEAYFKKWAGGKTDLKTKSAFIQMLEAKAYIARTNNKTIWAYDRERTAKELDEMLIDADDNLITKQDIK